MEEPDREPSVLLLDPEDKQGEKNETTNREPGRGRPVSNPAAKNLLETIQQLRAERKQQINNFLQREADGTLRDRDRLSIKLETQKFLELEEGVRKFLEGGCK